MIQYTYSKESIDPTLFVPVQNEPFAGFWKKPEPGTGLWSSPMMDDSQTYWYEYASSNVPYMLENRQCYRLYPSPDARIYVLNTVQDMLAMKEQYGIINERFDTIWTIDFEAMSQDYDALLIPPDAEDYYQIQREMAWDLPSALWFNFVFETQALTGQPALSSQNQNPRKEVLSMTNPIVKRLPRNVRINNFDADLKVAFYGVDNYGVFFDFHIDATARKLVVLKLHVGNSHDYSAFVESLSHYLPEREGFELVFGPLAIRCLELVYDKYIKLILSQFKLESIDFSKASTPWLHFGQAIDGAPVPSFYKQP